MKRFRAILLVSAAAAAVTLTASGSSSAASTPVPVTSQNSVVFQLDDDTTGCRSHRMDRNDTPADPING